MIMSDQFLSKYFYVIYLIKITITITQQRLKYRMKMNNLQTDKKKGALRSAEGDEHSQDFYRINISVPQQALHVLQRHFS